MRLKTTHILLVISLSVYLFNCTVSKRHYRKGYHVAWHPKSVKEKKLIEKEQLDENNKPSNQVTTIEREPLQASQIDLSASSNNDFSEMLSKTKPIIHLLPTDSCADVIVFRDGSEITAKIVEIYNGTIRYLPCNNLTGPLRVANGDKIFMIKYANGAKEVFKEQTIAPVQTYPNTRTDPAKKKTNVLALISFISGILGFIPFFGLIAFILGTIALRKIALEPDKYSNKWMAIFGMISGAIWLLIYFLIIFGF